MTYKYVATINVPGYLSLNSDPPVFNTPQEAWAYLAKERELDEDSHPGLGEYSDTVSYLNYAAGDEVQYGNPHEDWPLNTDGTGAIYGDTPGYDGEHDLGLAYTVSAV